MRAITRFVGLDVHAATIAVVVAEAGRDGEVRSLGTIPNDPESVRRLIAKLGNRRSLQVCYEAGPCGYALYWQLTSMGVECFVIAPSLIPKKAGDKVKTDRRDAEKLARCLRAGELTPVWVPDVEHEALRDLVRGREAAKKDELRARHRVSKFLLRRGIRRPEDARSWGAQHMAWLRSLSFERVSDQVTFGDFLAEVDHAGERVKRYDKAIDEAIAVAPEAIRALIEGLKALRGVATTTATTLAVEIGPMSRFKRAPQLMAFSGLVPCENSTGNSTRRGKITRTGNPHLRRIAVEAAWSYRFRPALRDKLRRRQEGASAAVREIAWKAQNRLHSRYRRLIGRGVPKSKVVTALAREFLGFVWAIGMQVERELAMKAANRKTAA